MNAEQPLSGTVQGQTIQLDLPCGFADGTKVLVKILPVATNKTWGDGIRASAGTWADIPGLDDDLAEILADRKRDTRPEI